MRTNQAREREKRDASQNSANDGATGVHGSEFGAGLHNHSGLRFRLLSSLLGEKKRAAQEGA
ncbi:uncharacterized protein A4U43_C08F30530 [Asparagus officinalis]|nr:uncharacterized protein A4U43_C08F30530 [Asparagus officinalis]